MGWHLNNHLGNVLMTRALAKDTATVEYDEAIHIHLSQTEKAR